MCQHGMVGDVEMGPVGDEGGGQFGWARSEGSFGFVD